MTDFTPTPEAVEAVRHCMSREFSLTKKQARAAIAAFVEAEGLTIVEREIRVGAGTPGKGIGEYEQALVGPWRKRD